VVNLDAINGVVTLRGEVDMTTREDLEQAVREVEGVRDVISYLHAPGTVAPNEEDVRG
jgi:osmotically-inducible protein OsmY